MASEHELTDRRWTTVVNVIIGIAIALVLALAGMGYSVSRTYSLAGQNRVLIDRVARLAEDGRQAKIGICSFKVDLAERIHSGQANLDRSEQFLKEHPNGIPGISSATIVASIKSLQTSLAGQRAALQALGVLRNCNPNNG